MTILGLAESSKTMNRPEPILTLFDGLFPESINDREVKFWNNFHSSL